MCLHPSEPRSRREFVQVSLAALGGIAFPGMLLAGERDPALRDRPDLEVALRAERWIRAHRIPTPAGVTWPADAANPASAQTSLYSGSPGVVLFLLELHHATGEARFLDEARAGADHLAAAHASPAADADAGLYTGLAGVAFTLHETYRATGEARYRDAARALVGRIVEGARPAGAGVEWSESADIVSGSAGIGLFLLQWHQREGGREALDLAYRAGLRLMELGREERGGLKWALAPTVPNLYPNFSHGTAGVAYFLASLYADTSDRRLLEAALAGARYLEAVAPAEEGFRVFHHEPGGEELYYLSWCHGPPGTARLFQRLGEATGDARWTRLVDRCARALQESGVPEGRTPGFWNNLSQCCGDAGVGEFFLALHRTGRGADSLRMARRCADSILARATASQEGLRWVQAEHRVRPELLQAQTGLMQGAAGVGLFFLHLDALERRRPSRVVLPDTPFA